MLKSTRSRHDLNRNLDLTHKMKTPHPFLVFLFLASAVNGFAAEGQKDPTFLDPAQAGPDFIVQGEYTGAIAGSGKKLAAQVIALGDGKFRAVFLQDGLPGAGWDKSPKIEIDGQTDGGQTTFPESKGYSAAIAKGTLTGKTDQGQSFKLSKRVRLSPTLGAKPPPGAIVLFDGSNTDAWQAGHMDERKLLPAGTKTRENFQDFSLHAEFLLPFKPFGRGQGRGNSGVYLQDRYEVQVLDSFGLRGANNECAGIYSQIAPSVNMCFPPLQWQTYDIDFRAAQFDAEGKKIKNAVVTVKHNGVVVHDQQEIRGPTGGGKPEGPTPGAIQLQGHGNPVFFRNIWLVKK